MQQQKEAEFIETLVSQCLQGKGETSISVGAVLFQAVSDMACEELVLIRQAMAEYNRDLALAAVLPVVSFDYA